ncbi:MAG: DUF3343 domain-containing protein [Clostridia bacterium]|nr:DUF3343 domain-containing protein [Clostridia bacterium]MBO7246322.1 DUF3343 domain-containing protein [Clostridia bacterium]MBO7737814.1 DUF3343 domain-containing protein [Clostridia bacterium]
MDTVIVLTSMTYAYKAQEILNRQGINNSLTRNAQTARIRGCGYGLKIDDSQSGYVQKLLSENGIKIAGITGAGKK